MEWKLGPAGAADQSRNPLKPSLVEWKPGVRHRGRHLGEVLETFLSGMETRRTHKRSPRFPALETFLSGMETP